MKLWELKGCVWGHVARTWQSWDSNSPLASSHAMQEALGRRVGGTFTKEAFLVLSFEKPSTAGPPFMQEQVKTSVQGRVFGMLAQEFGLCQDRESTMLPEIALRFDQTFSWFSVFLFLKSSPSVVLTSGPRKPGWAHTANWMFLLSWVTFVFSRVHT